MNDNTGQHELRNYKISMVLWMLDKKYIYRLKKFAFVYRRRVEKYHRRSIV